MSMEIRASQRIDSRAKPTVKATVSFDGFTGSALVPSGASTGSREARELRDGGNAYLGFGVDKAIRNIVESIAPRISRYNVTDQSAIDDAMIELDGTENKNRLGANAMLAVSLAVARAASEYKGVPLYEHLADLHGNRQAYVMPIPMLNVVNGGAHAKNGLDFQEFMIRPEGLGNYTSQMRAALEIYGSLGKLLQDQGRVSGVGDEGGYSPTGFQSESGRGRVIETLNLLVDAIRASGYIPGKDVSIAMDPAASEFYRDGLYHLAGGEHLTPAQMVDFCEELVNSFPITSVEDFVAEDDDEGWRLLTDRLGYNVQLVGDDRFVTNPAIFMEGILNDVGNAILVKPNQIGTVTETLQVIRMAEEDNYGTVISHRSGETEDTFIADLAVGTNAGQIKTGAPARGERTAKYNRLFDIQDEIDHLKRQNSRIPRT